MNEIKGMKEAFEKAKVVFLTTYKDGNENSRQRKHSRKQRLFSLQHTRMEMRIVAR